jgi:hypothetical protein
MSRTCRHISEAAQPKVLTGPAKLGADYVLFRVTRALPAGHRTLGQVRPAIEQQLREDEQRKALAAFNEAWRARWVAQTVCSPGYVVEDCRQTTVEKPAAGPERRYFEIVEGIRSLGAARQTTREMAAGQLERAAVIHESLDRSVLDTVGTDRRAAVKAIFAAHLGVVTGPVRLYRRYAVFVVNRIVPDLTVRDIR